MTTLSLAVRNLLAQDEGLKALLGRSASWDTWIFDQKPVNVKIENTSKCFIVINESGTWAPPNLHNTMLFPRLIIDVWADPTRNANKTVQKFDAQNKVGAIQKFLDKHLHTVDPGTPSGEVRIWGTEEEIAAKTGVVVTGSQRLTGPDFSPIRDSEGSVMGSYTYGVNVP